MFVYNWCSVCHANFIQVPGGTYEMHTEILESIGHLNEHVGYVLIQLAVGQANMAHLITETT